MRWPAAAAPAIAAAEGKSTGAQLSVVQDPAAPSATYTVLAYSAAGCAAGSEVDEAASSATGGTGVVGDPFLLPYAHPGAAQLWFKVRVMGAGSTGTATSTDCTGPVVVGEGRRGWRKGAAAGAGRPRPSVRAPV